MYTYDIVVDQESGLLLPLIKDGEEIVAIATQSYHSSKPTIHWIVRTLALIDPEGPCHMTRKKVYNERVYGRPMFWELTTYNCRGDKLRTAQYSAVMQEPYLTGLVADYFGFPLEAAEEIE